MFIRSKACFRIGESYFEAETDTKTIDIARYHQLPAPLLGARCTSLYTIVIPLQGAEDELFSRLKKDTRNEIRRSMREGVVHHLVRRVDEAYSTQQRTRLLPRQFTVGLRTGAGVVLSDARTDTSTGRTSSNIGRRA
jgi:hypothetical protein